MLITVFHNAAQDEQGRNLGFFGYKPEHPLLPVFQYVGSGFNPETANLSDHDYLDRAYHLFNVGDDPTFGEPSPIAVAYRSKHLRSLSVGDVVSIEGRMYAVADCGFERLNFGAEAKV